MALPNDLSNTKLGESIFTSEESTDTVSEVRSSTPALASPAPTPTIAPTPTQWGQEQPISPMQTSAVNFASRDENECGGPPSSQSSTPAVDTGVGEAPLQQQSLAASGTQSDVLPVAWHQHPSNYFGAYQQRSAASQESPPSFGTLQQQSETPDEDSWLFERRMPEDLLWMSDVNAEEWNSLKSRLPVTGFGGGGSYFSTNAGNRVRIGDGSSGGRGGRYNGDMRMVRMRRYVGRGEYTLN